MFVWLDCHACLYQAFVNASSLWKCSCIISCDVAEIVGVSSVGMCRKEWYVSLINSNNAYLSSYLFIAVYNNYPIQTTLYYTALHFTAASKPARKRAPSKT